MTIFLTILVVLAAIMLGIILYTTMKTLGILVQIVEFVNNYVQIKEKESRIPEVMDKSSLQ